MVLVMATDAPRLFVFGLGYSAQVFARRLRARGWRVAGTTRSPEAATAFRAEGVEAFLFERERPLIEPAAALAGTTHLLAGVPPDPTPALARLNMLIPKVFVQSMGRRRALSDVDRRHRSQTLLYALGNKRTFG